MKWLQKFVMNCWYVVLLSSAGCKVISHLSCCWVHRLTSGPLMQVRAMVILLMNEARAGTS